MPHAFGQLRVRQLDRSLAAFEAARSEPRPQRGWLRAIRQALGLSSYNVGQKLKIPHQYVLSFETAEMHDRITLASLRRVANALDCELVYAIVPKSGTLKDLSKRLKQAQVREEVLDVEQNMALEQQAPGGVDELVQEETERRLKK